MAISEESRRKMGWKQGLVFTKYTVFCVICGKPFETVPTSSKQFCCSVECGNKRKTKNRNKICKMCQVLFVAKKPSGIEFCSKKCAANYRYQNHKYKIRPSAVVPREMMKSCNRCGFDKYPAILERHHKDRDRQNNNLLNLEILCPNCHDIDHFLHGDGRIPMQMRQ